MIELDPWKRIDKKFEFDLPETIFQFDGLVAKPVENFYESHKLFTADKIRNAQIISKTIESSKVKYVALVIQYENCIATAGVNSNSFCLQCKPEEMLLEYQVRGVDQSVYFAQKTANNFQISKISFHKKFSKRLIKTQVWRTNDRIVSLERDSEYQPLSVFKNNTTEDMNEALYVLCENK